MKKHPFGKNGGYGLFYFYLSLLFLEFIFGTFNSLHYIYIVFFSFLIMKPIFKRKILKNGITLLFEKRDLPVVSIAFAVRCGGVNESISEKGISHFIEHMLYKGTSIRNSKKIAEEIEKRGGELNGFTS